MNPAYINWTPEQSLATMDKNGVEIAILSVSAPLCCRTLLPDVSPILTEIPQDTARAVTNLLFTGTFARFRDIRFIFTHAGGNVPMLLGRMHQYGPKDIAEKAPNGIEYELKRHYYDYCRYCLSTSDCSTHESGSNHTNFVRQR